MKPIIVICAVALTTFASSCSSENKQEKMWDTTVNADTGIIDTTDTNANGTGTSRTTTSGTIKNNASGDTVNRDNTIKADSVRQ